jgi:hypothetical protein
MLDESKIIPPSELFATIPDYVNIIEIDVTKAYTSDFNNMLLYQYLLSLINGHIMRIHSLKIIHYIEYTINQHI